MQGQVTHKETRGTDRIPLDSASLSRSRIMKPENVAGSYFHFSRRVRFGSTVYCGFYFESNMETAPSSPTGSGLRGRCVLVSTELSSHVPTASQHGHRWARAGAPLGQDLAKSLMVGLWEVKRPRLLFCCGSHQTGAVGVFVFAERTDRGLSSLFSPLGPPVAHSCALMQCRPVIQPLLCAGPEGQAAPLLHKA